MNTVHYSSKTDEWPTPVHLFQQLNEEFHFDLDPCATPSNAKCQKYYTRDDDGLTKPWIGRVFMNPPYGRAIAAWVQKAFLASRAGALVVCLLPARTDTRWFHDYCLPTAEIRFLRGRLKFGDATNSAPFPSMVVIFRPSK